jgi:hypothetical protein
MSNLHLLNIDIVDMSGNFLNQELSKYNLYILDRIICSFATDKAFNIYTLIEESVLHKCILPSQNEIVMETYYAVKEFLVNNDFVVEQKEMTAYVLTGKGMELKACGSLEQYNTRMRKKNKTSFLRALFTRKQKSKKYPADRLAGAEYYE